MINREKADEYFSHHLCNGTWSAKSEDERSAALMMAEQDVSLELGGAELDYDNPIALAAVCEQALFLLENGANGIAGQSRGSALVSSESVEGIGSRTYRAGLRESDFAISGRARRFIELLRGSNGGSVKISRG